MKGDRVEMTQQFPPAFTPDELREGMPELPVGAQGDIASDIGGDIVMVKMDCLDDLVPLRRDMVQLV